MTEKAEPTLTFSNVAEWDAWLAKHHDRSSAVLLASRSERGAISRTRVRSTQHSRGADRQPEARARRVGLAPALLAASGAAIVATRAPFRGEALIVSMDHPERAVVGDAFHLNCIYNRPGDPSQYVPEQDLLVWYSDPPDALGFATRSYTLPLRPGPA